MREMILNDLTLQNTDLLTYKPVSRSRLLSIFTSSQAIQEAPQPAGQGAEPPEERDRDYQPVQCPLQIKCLTKQKRKSSRNKETNCPL